MCEAEDEGGRLTERETLNMLRLLLSAGNETTANLIGNGMLALLRHPEQLQRLRNDPSLVPAAAEARFSQINRVIDLIYKALAPVLPNDIIAGSTATLSFAAYSGLKPDGEYWVFLEVNEGSYGGRPSVEDLVTRLNKRLDSFVWRLRRREEARTRRVRREQRERFAPDERRDGAR